MQNVKKTEIKKGEEFKGNMISLNGSFSQPDTILFRNASNSSYYSNDLEKSYKLKGRFIFSFCIILFSSYFLLYTFLDVK